MTHGVSTLAFIHKIPLAPRNYILYQFHEFYLKFTEMYQNCTMYNGTVYRTKMYLKACITMSD
jgi:hypothetical protein